jgi:hypothetical protein
VPEDGDLAVQLEVVLAAQFDRELDPTTLTTETFTLFEPDGAQVRGSVRLGLTPAVAVFTPAEPLTLITNYTATVTTGLLGVDGQALEEDFTWRFRTIDDEWGTAEDISQNTLGDAQSPQIGVDSAGNAIAVWQEFDGVRSNVVASRYTRLEVWGAPEPVEAAEENAVEVQLAVDPEGNAFAVWRQMGAGRDSIWANRYTVGEDWGTPTSIEAEAGLAGDISTTPRVAVDSNGNAIALWYQTDRLSSGFNVWSNRYTVGEGWAMAESIETEPPSFRQPNIDLGFDAGGNAIAVWTRAGQNQDDAWANRYTPGEGWGSAELIETNDMGGLRDLVVAVTSDGDAHALWSQFDDNGVRSLWTNVYSSGAWGDTADVFDDEDVNAAETPQITAGPNGELHAVWSQSDGNLTNIWANMYTPTPPVGWGTPELIELPPDDPQDDGNARLPQLSVDSEGNVFAVWDQFGNSRFNIWSNRFTPAQGWLAAEMIEMEPGSAILPQVAVAPGRRAHAVWQQDQDGTKVIRANRFE